MYQHADPENVCELLVGLGNIRTTLRMRLSLSVKAVKGCGGGGRFIEMGRIQLTHTYESIISVENLLEAWKEFVRGKRSRADVQEFGLNLMSNIFALHRDLAAKTYQHSPYEAFNISDPKPRNIHKACVRDRLLHHALYCVLYPFFDRTFIYDSYSCRQGKGTHKAMDRFRAFGYQLSQNHTHTVWILKCDVRKFFASIDHACLLELVNRYIPDKDIVRLVAHIVESFHSVRESAGLPLGNLTSQLLVNIYMNEFDQFAKHKLKAKHYIRYADDFVLLSTDKQWLENALVSIGDYLGEKLRLTLHPDKVSIQTLASGVDFLGWVHFPDHRVLRTATKRRVLKRTRGLEEESATAQSYLGLLKHGNTEKLRQRVKDDLQHREELY